jgi:hypothetical protein
MSCPGLHCPGCSGGQSLGITGGVVAALAVAAETVQWVADRIWWIGGTVTVCFAVAVAAGMWLERWADRRGARFAAAHGILSRADVILPAPAAAAGLPQPQPRPAIGAAPRTVITGGTHIWLGAIPDAASAAPLIRTAFADLAGDAVAVLRTALPEQAGEAGTSRTGSTSSSGKESGTLPLPAQQDPENPRISGVLSGAPWAQPAPESLDWR